jgi:predicted dehydrogenase
MTIAAARAGAKAILCEKPIGLSLGEADEMIAACAESGALLVVGHQRRFSAQYVAARDLIAAGAIGRVHYVEAYNHPNSSLLVDGTHTVDLVNYFLGDEPVEWVIGQVDARQHRSAWGQRIEDGALAYLRYRSGVRCLLTLGGYRPPGSGPNDRPEPITPVFDWNYHKLVAHGETGRVEVDGDAPYQDRPIVRLIRGDRVEAVPLPWPLEGDANHRPPIAAEIELMIDWLEGKVATHPGRAERARAALEVLMAVYESSRRRQFVTLPLAIDDNPLFDLLDRGEV